MTPEEARMYFLASTFTGALLAAAALGVVRLLTGKFGTIIDDADGLGTYLMDQGVCLIVWLLVFFIGLLVCVAPLHGKDVPEHAINGMFLAVCILGQQAVYFLGTSAVLLYRHFVMYHGVRSRLKRARMWRDASRRIDCAIGSSTHVQELEDAYDKLNAMMISLDNDYSPFRFKTRDARFTAGMAALRVSSAMVVALLARTMAGGAA